MIKRLILLTILMTVATQAFAQELFFKKGKYSSELYLKLNTTDVRTVEKRENEAVIFFNKQIRSAFKSDFDDEFIKSVSGSGDAITIAIEPSANFSIVNDIEGIKVIATKERTNTETLSSYGIGSPLIESNAVEDKDAARVLTQADTYIINKQFQAAVRTLEGLLKTSKNEFYRQEAMYKLGDTYLLMAEYDDIYLTNAYTTFDEFVQEYPSNFRVIDALMKSAEAKVRENQLFEAIRTYELIYNSAPDVVSRREALIKIAELYKGLGQNEQAVEKYQDYLRNFKTGQEAINLEIGMIYYIQNDLSLAYEYFYRLKPADLIADKSVDLEALFAVAKTFDIRERYAEALDMYLEVFARQPESNLAVDASLRAAELLELLGRNAEADKLLLTLKDTYPDQQAGQQAAVKYAKKYLESKSSSYWKEFFAGMLQNIEDPFNNNDDAEYVIIKALQRENASEEVMDRIKNFTGVYIDSPYYDELNAIREEFLFAKATSTYNTGDFAAAEPVLNYFKAEYPESAYIPRVDKMLVDIRFTKVEDMYNNNEFSNAIEDIEKYLADYPNALDAPRWTELYDNASYKEIAVYSGAKDYPFVRVKGREYLSVFPTGNHVQPVITMLEDAIRAPMLASDSANDYPAIIMLYEANQQWLDDWKNEELKDTLELITANALYRSGLVDKSKLLYDKVKPVESARYITLGILLGDTSQEANLNKLEPADFEFVVTETALTNPDKALQLAQRYDVDKKLAYKLMYDIAKSTINETKRQEILLDIYGVLRDNTAARFDGSDNVFLDVGLLMYRKNDFQGAIEPLNQFVMQHTDLDEKRAEALYYLGKSFVMMQSKERGYQYYNELINTMPNSIYSGIAQSELDENSWRNGLNN